MQATGAMGHAYQCPQCTRRWFVVGEDSADSSAKCACGSPLVADALAAGTYEIQASSASAATASAPTAAPAPSPPPGARPRRPKHGASSLPVEDDLGYGASHGYGPGHGGPTGPGDAPALDTEVPSSSKRASTPEESAQRR
ncbi:hypothetical protein [Polyangium aurulentum]|uniref:hypothetical protein n=1 Tax=Polyangium aurulentum TaxID=2567896 RepID=UPI00197E2FE6|nr:hypothetical protein [Polyangium aurulentum]UQA56629.1 hypothetical protein E8A73_035775 [Polyangium aurulentum]